MTRRERRCGISGTERRTRLARSEEAVMTLEILASVAAVAAGAIVGPVGAAEGPRGAIFAGKFEVSGNDIQGIGVGKDGEGFALVYEEDVTATGGSDHKMHCLGVMQLAANTVAEQHGYCVETDPDGDQALWKVTPAPHLMGADAVQAVHEAIAGAGKYAGVSTTIKSTCNLTSSGPRYALSCESQP